MNHDHSTVAVFEAHDRAEAAIRRLSEAGFPIGRLSIVGKGYQTEEQVVGFYNLGDRVKLWGKNGALWGGLWGLLATGVFMSVPVLGPVIVLGHLAAMVVGGLEGAVVAGGIGALGGALASLGVPKDSVLRYEQDLKAEHFLVVVHGSADDARRAQALLSDSKATRVDIHASPDEGVGVSAHTGHGAHETA